MEPYGRESSGLRWPRDFIGPIDQDQSFLEFVQRILHFDNLRTYPGQHRTGIHLIAMHPVCAVYASTDPLQSLTQSLIHSLQTKINKLDFMWFRVISLCSSKSTAGACTASLKQLAASARRVISAMRTAALSPETQHLCCHQCFQCFQWLEFRWFWHSVNHMKVCFAGFSGIELCRPLYCWLEPTSGREHGAYEESKKLRDSSTLRWSKRDNFWATEISKNSSEIRSIRL